MIKFFTRIRQQLLSENKFNKYLLYAIGEIILVVIGILIALQINNWNEKRQNKHKVDNLLIKVQKDIESDISEIVNLSKFYAAKDSLIQLVLNDKLTSEDYQNPRSVDLHYLIFNFSRSSLRNVGNTNLMRAQDIITPEYDSILELLSKQYDDKYVNVKETEKSVNKITDSYFDILFEKHDWFSSQAPYYLNQERIDYFVNNVRYKGMVNKYQTYGIKNYFNSNIEYGYAALDSYENINNQLGIESKKKIFGFTIDSTIIGKYRTFFNEEFELVVENNKCFIKGNEKQENVNLFPYDTNKFAFQGTFGTFRTKNDSINLYITGYEYGSKPYATKIE